eukprot:907848-Pyramimonas_sp.AAC.1
MGQLRQMAALQLATRLRTRCRWMPSEVNPADRPSRQRGPTLGGPARAWRPPPGLIHPDAWG